MPTFSVHEVGRHTCRDDLWLIINEKVYDLSHYVKNHPGGDAILRQAGQDATDAFNKIPSHSVVKGLIQDILKKAYIAYPRPSRSSDTCKEGEMLAMRDCLQERYHKTANICLVNSWPHSYSYHPENSAPPSMAEHHQVHIKKRLKSPEFAPGIDCVWLKLNGMEKDKLYMILLSAILIWEKIYYDDEEEVWMNRQQPPDEDSFSATLKYYGDVLPAKSVLHHLAGSRSKEEMARCITNIERVGLMYHQLDSAWIFALFSGMTNGAGRTAVHKLLEGMSTLLQGLETILPNLPAVAVFHVTTSTKSDALSISSSSLSNSSRLSCTSDVKRHKLDDTHVQNDKTDKKGKDNCDKADKPKTCSVAPNLQNHIVDLSIITRDTHTGVAKYIFVVEIHSTGKSFEEANQEFLQEIIFVLQGQNEVFGLFFSTLCVLLYTARKTASGEIVIWKDEYSLLEGSRRGSFDNFSVTHFQKLVMDIFSCLVHGIKQIDA